MRIALKGARVMVAGRFKGWRVSALRERLVAEGAVMTQNLSEQVELLIAGTAAPSQRIEACARGIAILDEHALDSLLERGVYEPPEPEVDPGALGDLRALLHDDTSQPSSWLWQTITSLLDVAPPEQLEAMVAYVHGFTERWEMNDLWGTARELVEPQDAEIHEVEGGHFIEGVEGELRVAPLRWLGELYRGVNSPKFGLVHALDLEQTHLEPTAMLEILSHPQLVNVSHIVTPAEMNVSESCVQLLCANPWRERLKVLRLSAFSLELSVWFHQYGTQEGRLTCLDVSQYHATCPMELLDAPYFANLDTLKLWDYQLPNFAKHAQRPITHLVVDGADFKTVAKALKHSLLYEHLATLRIVNYHSADWKKFFELDYEGKLDLLALGHPVAYQRESMARGKKTSLNKSLQSSTLLAHVSRLDLEFWAPHVDLEALHKAQPHLEIVS